MRFKPHEIILDAPLNAEQANKNAKTICVVGGGPSGLIALKAVLDAPEFKVGRSEG